jgi:hypothetical protein
MCVCVCVFVPFNGRGEASSASCCKLTQNLGLEIGGDAETVSGTQLRCPRGVSVSEARPWWFTCACLLLLLLLARGVNRVMSDLTPARPPQVEWRWSCRGGSGTREGEASDACMESSPFWSGPPSRCASLLRLRRRVGQAPMEGQAARHGRATARGRVVWANH